jgi:8-oxo-dGTP diphosphatase
MPTTDPDGRLHIAVGIVRDSDNRFLVSQRPDGGWHSGKWEFPGGKVEVGETVFATLKRELAEELAIDVTKATPLTQLHFDYPQRHVYLDVWVVDSYAGQAVSNEGQRLRWVELNQLKKIDLLEANYAILELLERQPVTAS